MSFIRLVCLEFLLILQANADVGLGIDVLLVSLI
jgi:hypothetical protein